MKALILFGFAGFTCVLQAATPTYRVLISTDLGGDPDDIQSLYRLLHYSDILRVEGIVSSPGPGAEHSADKIVDWIQRIDINNMRRNGHPELMEEGDLIAMVRQGALRPGRPGPGRSTEGSRLIIERAHARQARGGPPLWVQVWGSLTDVAQAIYDEPSIIPKIRIYSIGYANTRTDLGAREYLVEGLETGKWPNLWWIENGALPLGKCDTFKGVHQGGEQSGEWNNVAFVERNIRGKGSTHCGDFAERAGDAFPLASYGQQRGTILKEGDSPAMLYLLSPALGGPGHINDPTQENWGGQFRHYDRARFPNYYVDLDATTEECWATINKWRVQFLSHWKERWNWYKPEVLPAR